MQQEIRADSSEIRTEFAKWLAQERLAGARLVILEGLMKSGKSELTKEPETLSPSSNTIELDKFIRKPANPETPYLSAIDIEAANQAIKQAMATAPLVIAEGAMAWPVTQQAREEVSPKVIRRVYLKRMSARNPNEWEELEFAQTEVKWRGEYFLSIDRYHVETKPWFAADLILERTGRDEEHLR
jgi:hypothetical protein